MLTIGLQAQSRQGFLSVRQRTILGTNGVVVIGSLSLFYNVICDLSQSYQFLVTNNRVYILYHYQSFSLFSSP